MPSSLEAHSTINIFITAVILVGGQVNGGKIVRAAPYSWRIVLLGVVEFLQSGKVSTTHPDFRDIKYSKCLSTLNHGMRTNGLQVGFLHLCYLFLRFVNELFRLKIFSTTPNQFLTLFVSAPATIKATFIF